MAVMKFLVKFLVKLVAKILVLPMILFLNFVMLVYNTVEGIVGLIAGILNIVFVLVAVITYVDEGTLYHVKQALIFMAIESVLLGIPQLCAGVIMCLQERLVEFVFS